MATEAIHTLLTQHLPGYAVRSLVRRGEGWDNVVYEVNGELIVRQRKETEAARREMLTRREADLLAVVAQVSPLPVPVLVFTDDEAGVLAYHKLPGLPLSDQPVTNPARLAATLGAFISSLHQASPERMERFVARDVEPLAAWREEAEVTYRAIVDRLPATSRRLVEDFLRHVPPPEPRILAFCHNDLGSEHVLVDVTTNAVTGVIDWSDAAITDPVLDLALIYRDLGPALFDRILAHYQGHVDAAGRERAIFYARCALLEDIAYGLRTGAGRYAADGLARLVRTFT